MIQGLHKVIQKIILPKYPWIKGYNINSHYEDNHEYISVMYHPKPDESGFFSITEEFKEVEDLTKSLFKMLGFGPQYRFDGVGFQTRDIDMF